MRLFRRITVFCLPLLFAAAAVLPARAAVAPLASRSGFYFDTVITVSLYDTDDETILDECSRQMAYYESIFSRTVEGAISGISITVKERA